MLLVTWLNVKITFFTWMRVIIRSQQSWVNLCVVYLWKREIIWRRESDHTAPSPPYAPPHHYPSHYTQYPRHQMYNPYWDTSYEPLRYGEYNPYVFDYQTRDSGQSAEGGPGRWRSGEWKLALVIMSHRETSISPICHTVKLGVGGVEKSPLQRCPGQELGLGGQGGGCLGK